MNTEPPDENTPKHCNFKIGALGTPVWVALSQAADWRFLRDREDNPWYPTMRLFRQIERGDWVGVFGRVRDAVQNLSRLKASGR